MKTIKFRAWDKENKEMVEIDAKFFFQEGRCVGVNDGKWTRGEGTFEVMQFTGLFDKNGKEIYEGDIIKLKFSNKPIQIWRVDWNSTLTGFTPFQFFSDKDKIEDFKDRSKTIEVIGNIYENPELI